MIEYNRRTVFSWALYDWANSAYATTVMAAFFPIFFKRYWSEGIDASTVTFNLGLANSIASLIILLLAPLLGAIADRWGAKKRFLAFFAFLGAIMTGSMSLVVSGHWPLAMLLYIFGTIGFSGANIFYDSLLVSIAPKEKIDFVSAVGYSLGYFGGGLLLLINAWMIWNPQLFGLQDAVQATKAAFLTVAFWWAVFSLPVMLFVKEPPVVRVKAGWDAVAAGFRQLAATFREIRKLRVVFIFLIGFWLYIDGVDTIVRMAVDYGLSLGFSENNLVLALLITQAVGMPAALAFGKIGERLGPKAGIYICIAVYLVLVIWASRLDSTTEFYTLAVGIGLVQGGIQSLSRSFYARLIPKDKAAEFYGFYNMMGKFAAVLGPVMVGTVGLLTGSPRLSILSISVLFLAGGAFLYFVDESEGRRAAAALSDTPLNGGNLGKKNSAS